MLNFTKWTNIIGILVLLLIATTPAATTQAQDGDTIAFVNVNVIPMDTERVLEAQTVIVQGDRIVEIGAADAVSVPSDAQVIDGNGQYLIPGLTDAHVHIFENQDALTLFVANGITTVRDPNVNYRGNEIAQDILNWRDQIEAGELLGPTYYTAKSFSSLPPTWPLWSYSDEALGPWLSLNQATFEQATDPETARELVIQAHDEGYDMIKVNWFISRETFDSIVATADELGMPVLAHVPRDVGIEHTIEAGVEIQHNYNLQAFVARDYERNYGANALDSFDFSEADERLPELIALMLENGVAFTPTMVVDVAGFQLMDSLPDISQAPMLQRPEYRYVPQDWMVSWVDPNGGELAIVLRDSGANSIEEIVPSPENRAQTLAYQQRQLKALVDAGVPVLVGTDCSALAVVWGFAIHDELALFVESGLTPYQALSAATRIPAEVMGGPDEWGTIEVGKRADMVLLNANPLEDISNTRNIAGVMLRGRWLPQAELQGMLDELAASYEAEVAALSVIELEPSTNEEAGFSTVIPTGWNEILPGAYSRGNPAADPTIWTTRCTHCCP